MTAFTRTTKAALSAAVALGVFAAASAPASAEAPPAAAGTTSHGFLFDDGVVTTIDHPDANTILDTPDDQAGTLTSGINDRGDVLGAYERQDRVVPHFVRDRKGRYTLLGDPPGGAVSDSPLSPSTSTTGARSSASTTTTRGTPPPASCAPGTDGSSPSRSPTHR